jgi:hypothetical protein
MNRLNQALAFAALMLLPASAQAAAASCNESCMLDIADTYLGSLTANDLTGTPFAARVRWTENGKDIGAGQGIWKTATAWSYRHTIVDPEAGGIATFGSVREANGKNAIIAVRLKVAGKLITESEVMTSREGDFGLFNTDTVEAKPIFGQVLPVEDRVTRARLKEIAESYFQGISREDPTIVPFHPDCNRVENGVQTTNSPPRMMLSCYESLRRFKYMSNHRETRFPVVDTKRGLVLAITAFDMPVMRRTTTIRGRPHEISPEIQHLPRTMFLYELFKVDGGKIRQIEAVMRNESLGTSMGWEADR